MELIEGKIVENLSNALSFFIVWILPFVIVFGAIWLGYWAKGLRKPLVILKHKFELIQEYAPIIVNNKRTGSLTQYTAWFSANKPIKNLYVILNSFSCWEDETIKHDFSKNKLIFAEETEPNAFYKKEIFTYRSDTQEFIITFMNFRQTIQLKTKHSYDLDFELTYDKAIKERLSYLVKVDSDKSIEIRPLQTYEAGVE